MTQTLTDHRLARILWIDPSVSPRSHEVAALQQCGLTVKCVATVSQAIIEARALPFVALIAELALPDASAVALLEALRTQGLIMPSMILTSHNDVQAACMAGRAGATHFALKPLPIDTLTRLVVDMSRTPVLTPLHVDTKTGMPSVSYSALVSAYESSLTTGSDALGAERCSHTDIESAALSAMLMPDVSIYDFLRYARLFRLVRARAAFVDVTRSFAGQQFDAASGAAFVGIDRTVSKAIGLLVHVTIRGGRATETNIARQLGVNRSHLGRLIRLQTGFGFSEWRLGILVQRALRALTSSPEQIKQIACRVLTYNHTSQFDRDFRRTLGLSPREFKALWRQSLSTPLASGHVPDSCEVR